MPKSTTKSLAKLHVTKPEHQHKTKFSSSSSIKWPMYGGAAPGSEEKSHYVCQRKFGCQSSELRSFKNALNFQ